MAKKKSLKPSKKQKENFELPEVNISDDNKRKIAGTILGFLTLFILISIFGKGGALGAGTLAVLRFFVGETVFILPLIFGFLAYTLFIDEFQKRWQIYLASFLLSTSASGILAMIKNGTPANGGIGGWWGYITYALVLQKYVGEIIGALFYLMLMGIAFWLLYPYLGLEKQNFEIKNDKKKDKEGNVFTKVFQPKFNVEKVPDNKQPKTNLAMAKKDDIKKEEKPKEEPLMDLKKNAIVKEKDYKFPSLELLEEEKGGADSGDIKASSLIIKRTLENFNISVEVSEVNVGPSVTQYAIKPAEGVDIKKIANMSSNLSMALSAHPIRIETPIPGRPLVGIEIPNKAKSIVRLRALLEDPQFQNPSSNLLMALGKDVSGNPIFADLMKMPHMLVAGSTNSGKTICMNQVLVSLLFLNSPNTMRLILVDPKRVEFTNYKNLPHLLTNVIVDSQKTVNALKWLTNEMERRFDVIGREGARDIQGYNKLMRKKGEEIMPYIVFAVDELADLMQTRGKELEAYIVRIAQLARASGIHMVLATQRPSVDVVTGLIKANVPARIAFRVASQTDSRTIIDMAGAEKLLGFGDMLFLSSQSPKPKRIQGALVDEKEVRSVVNFINETAAKEDFRHDEVSQKFEEGLKMIEDQAKAKEGGDDYDMGGDGDDPMYEEAKRVVLETRKASTSFLQRRLRLGYARAARMIDILEQNGIIGPGDGAKPREVLLTSEEIAQESAVSGPTKKGEDEGTIEEI
jgi:S-DNA-T family DNA segregation ATPase FtsK/SpoIIIE